MSLTVAPFLRFNKSLITLKTKHMNLPKVLADLVAAQNNADSSAYANCFSDTAVVYDEGKKHIGKEEIKN